ncbi:PEP-CTERM/exosortase system-associated acyltransferase [Hydrocarboniclastica marina]|uniref:PEP-CTERM/exosortase system-associated acyltransferase n=1 Tax=Hydrocarboniclastica marina TaxID=2259620 RepID=A0A4V1D8I6_9ALTE|nr:PEP-CTERM/exosortase system-associated acyltransferase [Hydrocarboniclastica marina]
MCAQAANSRQQSASTNEVIVLEHEYHPRIVNDISAHFYKSFALEPVETARQRQEMFQLRYQVYCLDRSFENPSDFPDQCERDLYDARAVHGLVRHKQSGIAIATVRLVLSQPSLGRGEFPMEANCLDALNGESRHQLGVVPREHLGELSRFAVSRNFRRRLGEADNPVGVSDRINYEDPEAEGNRALPYLTLGLFALIVRLSVAYDLSHWIAVMEPALIRLLRRFGINFANVGQTVDYHGRRKPVFSDISTVLTGIRRQRPDVWSFITDAGRYDPATRNAASEHKPSDRDWFIPQIERRRTRG